MVNREPAHKRETLREALLDAAEAVILKDGIQALRARSVTQAAGCALGALYNVFPDLDALILGVKVRILDRLDARLLETLAEIRLDAPESGLAALLAMTDTYLDFAWDDRRRWETLFQHHLAGGADLPGDDQARLGAIFSHVDVPLRVALGRAPPEGSARLARTLFSAVHGIVVMAVEHEFGTPSRQELGAEVEMLIRAAIMGLRAEPDLARTG